MDKSRDLSPGRCRELLATQVVGRVAVCTSSGPHIVPVNYALVDEAVVFRTTPYSVLGSISWSTQVAFEVDHLEPEGHRGWSVVAHGHGERVEDPDTWEHIKEVADPDPWVGGNRQVYVRLAWDQLTGREIG